MKKTRGLVVLLAVVVLLMMAIGPNAGAITNSTGGSDPTGANDPLTDDDSGPQAHLDISSWLFRAGAASVPANRLQGQVTLTAPLPTGSQLPVDPGDTGYSIYWTFQSGISAADAGAIAHQRTVLGLNADGERNAYDGPYPLGDFWFWALEYEHRFTGTGWQGIFTFSDLDPASGFSFRELLVADNPGLGVAFSNGNKTITLTAPYTLKWRSARSKGAGAGVGGATYNLYSKSLAAPTKQLSNVWVSTWANATTSLPPAVCAVTQPTAGVCGIGGLISQEDQAPNTATLLGEYGFASYYSTEKCPVFATIPNAAGGGYVVVNSAVAVNPFWRPCYAKLPLSRNYVATGLNILA